MSPDPTTVCHVADLHTNSTVSLCPPTINLDDGGTYHASRGQRWLWECWQDYIIQIGRRPGRKIIILGGDLGELDCKRRSVQIISQNKATIQAMVTEVLDPLLDVADKVLVIRGTPAHVGKSCWIEEAIAADLDNVIPFSPGIKSWYHFRGLISGYRYDVSHHAPMSGNEMTAPKSVIDLANKTLWYYRVILNMPAPDFVIRSHQHRYHMSEVIHGCRAMFAPCWSLAPEYLYRAGKEFSLADIGGLIIQDGQPEAIRYHPAEVKRVWAIKI